MYHLAHTQWGKKTKDHSEWPDIDPDTLLLFSLYEFLLYFSCITLINIALRDEPVTLVLCRPRKKTVPGWCWKEQVCRYTYINGYILIKYVYSNFIFSLNISTLYEHSKYLIISCESSNDQVLKYRWSHIIYHNFFFTSYNIL